jgi:hypothetical protein
MDDPERVRASAGPVHFFRDGGEITAGCLAGIPDRSFQDPPEHLPRELRMPHENRQKHLHRLIRAAALIPDKPGQLRAWNPDPCKPVEVHEPLRHSGRRQQAAELGHELDLHRTDLQPRRPQFHDPGGVRLHQ